jgi:iron complex outermembrane receptor protein
LVDPEFVWSYEIGFKTDSFNRRLRINGTAFYYDYTDLQLTTFSEGWQIRSNAAEATIKGFELELVARPIPALTVNGSVSYLDSQYDKYIAVGPTGPVDASGNPLNFAPEWKLIFGAQYVIPVGRYGFLTLRGDLTWTDDQYFSPIKEDLLGQKAYLLLDGTVRFETADGHWGVEVFGKNLTEEKYLTNAYTFPVFPDVVGQIAAPRTFGLSVVYKF